MISYRTSKALADCYGAFVLTSGLDRFYPEFNDWYWNKVAPSVMVGDSEIVLAEEHGQMIGVSLIKAGAKPKLRCLRVRADYANRGVGIHLIDRSLAKLGCDRPGVTVPEEKINELSRIMVNRFGFSLLRVDKGMYRPGMLEYVFNDCDEGGNRTAYGSH